MCKNHLILLNKKFTINPKLIIFTLLSLRTKAQNDVFKDGYGLVVSYLVRIVLSQLKILIQSPCSNGRRIASAILSS